MLGSIIKRRSWNWAAIGKHPAAKDYIRIGGTSPLIEAVAEWAAKGYQHLRPSKDQPLAFYSWRFWLQGVRKGEIVCGLGRDSSDRIGRPFPLMLLGEGLLKGWEKKWTDLPVYLGHTWKSMESIATRRFEHIRDMETALTDLKAPGYDDHHPGRGKQPAEACDLEMAPFHRQMDNDGFGYMPLNHSSHDDPETGILQCHRHLPKHCAQMPRGVFIGGSPQKSYLAAIEHPLGKNDFVRLWSI